MTEASRRVGSIVDVAEELYGDRSRIEAARSMLRRRGIRVFGSEMRDGRPVGLYELGEVAEIRNAGPRKRGLASVPPARRREIALAGHATRRARKAEAS